MKVKSIMNSGRWHVHWTCLLLIALCFASCKDDKTESNEFDPGKAVIISDFSPKEGGQNTRLILSGSNFGTDPSRIKITIGGVEAKIVGTTGTEIYCVVPNKAFEGSIIMSILSEDGEELKRVELDEKFIYNKKMVVSTLLGEKDEKGNYKVKDGPFDDCGGIERCSWLSFDPKNPKHLYFTADGNSFRLIDLEKDSLKTMFGNGHSGMNRMRSITWTLSGDSMIIATDRSSDGSQSNSVLTREQGFKDVNVLTQTKNCNGSAIHPANGELYFNAYSMGDVLRYDFKTKQVENLFSIQDKDWEFNVQIHPSGDYAYLVVVNKHYILRTDYDWNTKKFTTPYIICGNVSSSSWVDGVGKRARLSEPYQGVFVKNPEYAGKSDEYDFYFCDKMNHAIRILSPDGRVTTFAGRGSTGVNSNPYGYINGDLRLEARFDRPEAIAYDESTHTFYIGDYMNNRIRKISYEED